MMVGRELQTIYPTKSDDVSNVFFKVENFGNETVFRNIGFELRKGEILGLAGLVGAGRTEVVRAICGIDRCLSGTVFLNDSQQNFRQYSDAINAGVCYLTEDRKAQGLFLEMDITRNMTVTKIDDIANSFIIDGRKAENLAEEFCRKLQVKKNSISQIVNSLSGGNQQKVMIAKWLTQNPKILIMDEPTRGIDVGAKAEIHKMLRELSSQGIGIILISSELPEIIGMSDRVVVMHEGEITGEVSGADINEEKIMTYASGQHGLQQIG
jgi:ribose transport system ATP-binding protein